jgi:hypothetical protein
VIWARHGQTTIDTLTPSFCRHGLREGFARGPRADDSYLLVTIADWLGCWFFLDFDRGSHFPSLDVSILSLNQK